MSKKRYRIRSCRIGGHKSPPAGYKYGKWTYKAKPMTAEEFMTVCQEKIGRNLKYLEGILGGVSMDAEIRQDAQKLADWADQMVYEQFEILAYWGPL